MKQEVTVLEETSYKMLRENLGSRVLIRIRGDIEIRGKLRSFDQHLNIVLEDAEELKTNGFRKLGTIIIRGDTVILISSQKE